MGVGMIPSVYQTYEFEVLECGRTPFNPAEKFAILLDATVAGVAFGGSSDKVSILRRELKQANGYARRRIGRIISSLSSNTFTSVGHGFANGTGIFFAGSNPGSSWNAPSGLVSGTRYFVATATADTFQVADTVGGAAKTVSGLGSGVTVALSSGVYDSVDKRQESVPEIVRFQGQGAGFSYGGIAVVRGGSAFAPISISNFNSASSQITITSGHNLQNGDEVFFLRDTGAVLPTLLAEATIYFARSVSTNVFTLHLTRSDATSNLNAIAFTSAGSGTNFLCYANGEVAGVETFSLAESLTNGAEQPFNVFRYHMNSGNAVGL